MKVKVIGIDLAKNIFQLHGVDHAGKVILSRRLRREKLIRTQESVYLLLLWILLTTDTSK